jgi:3-hydroxyisobutyrate dehydrogenase-like beta-hydroxyacid dehydrogenase
MSEFRVALVGLGSMGLGMARSLVRAGITTHGFDVTAERVAQFQAEGGATGTLEDVAGRADALVVVVLNAAQCEDVLFGAAGVVPAMKPGSVVIACPTVAPEFARAMAERCAGHGVLYLDAPISGGAARADAGTLSIMAAGTPDAFAAARPVLDATAETVFELGREAGAGSAMKAVNQLLAGVHIATMAEAMAFGITQGIEPSAFLEVIPKCAGTSWIARSAGFEAPVTSAALERFKAAAEMGLGGEDDAAVIKVYARAAGLTLPGDA